MSITLINIKIIVNFIMTVNFIKLSIVKIIENKNINVDVKI